MIVFLLFLTYLLAFLALAALIVPDLYPFTFQPIGLDQDSSLYRFAMFAAALCLPFALRFVGLDSWRAAGYTLSWPQARRALALGLLIGVAIMLLLTAAQWALGLHHYAVPEHKTGVSYLLRYLLSGLISGLAVGLIEETFFRGLMHTGLRRSLGFWSAALLNSSLYAALHFMKPASLGEAPFDTANAFRIIAEGLARIAGSPELLDSFLTLILVGVFLSMIRERTGNILWAIGIHAGWVVVIKVVKFLTNPTRVDGETSFWLGGYDHITGWMATLWLGAIAAVYWWRTRPRTDR